MQLGTANFHLNQRKFCELQASFRIKNGEKMYDLLNQIFLDEFNLVFGMEAWKLALLNGPMAQLM
jgi:hypothetical protein